MQQEILFDRKFDPATARPFPADELFLLVGYQDEQLTFVAEALRYRPPGRDRFELEAFRAHGFGDGAELTECLAQARSLLVGGLFVCGLMLTSSSGADLPLLEEKARRLRRPLAEAEELSSPELFLLSRAEGRSRTALLNKSSMMLGAMRQLSFDDFDRRVGRLHLYLSGRYSAPEPADLADQSAFLSCVSVAVREDLRDADYLAEGRRVGAKSVLGPVAGGELARLRSSDGAVSRLLTTAVEEEARAGVAVSMALFCYYSFRNRLETVVEHLCQDFDRSLLSRAALAGDNAFLPARLLVANNGLCYNCYVSAAAQIKQGVQEIRCRLANGNSVEVLDYEKIDEFQWRSLSAPQSRGAGGEQKPEDFSRTLPRILTLCLAVLLAFLLKKLFVS